MFEYGFSHSLPGFVFRVKKSFVKFVQFVVKKWFVGGKAIKNSVVSMVRKSESRVRGF
jgi:hypothetical protein